MSQEIRVPGEEIFATQQTHLRAFRDACHTGLPQLQSHLDSLISQSRGEMRTHFTTMQANLKLHLGKIARLSDGLDQYLGNAHATFRGQDHDSMLR